MKRRPIRRRYTGSQHTEIARRRRRTRALLITLAVVLCLVSVLSLGVFLKRRSERMQATLESPFSFSEHTEREPADIPASHETPEAAPAYYGWLPVGHTAAGTASIETALESGAYHALSAVVYDGKTHRYALESYADTVHSEVAEMLISREVLREAAGAARDAGYGSCAATVLSELFSSEAAVAAAALSRDRAVAGELSNLGFTEVLFCGYPDGYLDAERCERLLSLLRAIREMMPSLKIGFALPEAVFDDGESAPHLEHLYEAADFLALDISAEADVLAVCRARSGSISYFGLHIAIEARADDLAAISGSLLAASFSSLHPLLIP